MKISEFDYTLPPHLVAQHSAEKREESRLMVVDRKTEHLEHATFRDVPRFLSPEDLLVLNNTRVLPARLYGRKNGYHRWIEVLLIRRCQGDVWEVLLKPGRRVRAGDRIVFSPGAFEALALESSSAAARFLRFEYRNSFEEWLDRLGKMPLPPYIHREPGETDTEDRERYQTVFARMTGSIAAPTAGLHFTPQILEQLPHCEITLHVGYGTFKPVTAESVEEHRMPAEYYEIGAQAAVRISQQLAKSHRIIGVGTTTTRVLEHVYSKHGKIVAEHGWTDLFIYPGFKFQAVGGLLTNFHLPRSTLLLLVSSFAGKKLIEKAYKKAIQHEYRFYSYGDVMLIL